MIICLCGCFSCVCLGLFYCLVTCVQLDCALFGWFGCLRVFACVVLVLDGCLMLWLVSCVLFVVVVCWCFYWLLVVILAGFISFALLLLIVLLFLFF